jgi:hypothetical protein
MSLALDFASAELSNVVVYGNSCRLTLVQWHSAKHLLFGVIGTKHRDVVTLSVFGIRIPFCRISAAAHYKFYFARSQRYLWRDL